MSEVKYYLPHSLKCFVCGSASEFGLKCRFYTDERGSVFLEPQNFGGYTGFMNVLHGGIQGAIIDEAMGWCAFTQTDFEGICFTRELNIKYKKNVIPQEPFILEANLVARKKNFFYSEAVIRDADGAILTQATGTFIEIPPRMMEGISRELQFIDDGRTYLPKAVEIFKSRHK